jgi:hypothetical protein
MNLTGTTANKKKPMIKLTKEGMRCLFIINQFSSTSTRRQRRFL